MSDCCHYDEGYDEGYEDGLDAGPQLYEDPRVVRAAELLNQAAALVYDTDPLSLFAQDCEATARELTTKPKEGTA